MRWPRHLLIVPVTPMPMADYGAVKTLDEFRAFQKKTPGSRTWSLPGSHNVLSLTGEVEVCVFGSYLFCKAWAKYKGGEDVDLDELDKLLTKLVGINGKASHGVRGLDPATLTSMQDGVRGEILLAHLIGYVYSPDIKTTSLVGSDGSIFFSHACAKTKTCCEHIARSCLHLEMPHQTLVTRLHTMIRNAANMMFNYCESLAVENTDEDVIRCMQYAIYYREKLQADFWFSNEIITSMMRVPARPGWLDRVCNVVHMSNVVGFNVSASKAEPGKVLY
jgi:hypothetical protein